MCAEWDYEKNEDITPGKVTLGSDYKAWWKCENGHSFQSTVANRVAGKGCPVCSGHKVIPGVNDLATKMPELARQWHSFKNGDWKPSDVAVGSGKKAWWQCNICGHEWEAVIGSRSKGSGCPKCSKKKKVIFHSS